MAELTIRPYEKKDFRYVQDICMQTSSLKDNDTPLNRAILCSLYCDYYLDNQAEFCFVAVDENDVPQGYILCAADCGDYLTNMEEYYLPLLRKLDSGEFFRFNAQMKVEQRYIREGFTAHLHIDILEEYQEQGVGTRLMETLCNKLQEVGVEGVRLICSKKNVKACEFYKKMGFEDVDYITGAIVFGKKFFEE